MCSFLLMAPTRMASSVSALTWARVSALRSAGATGSSSPYSTRPAAWACSAPAWTAARLSFEAKAIGWSGVASPAAAAVAAQAMAVVAMRVRVNMMKGVSKVSEQCATRGRCEPGGR